MIASTMTRRGDRRHASLKGRAAKKRVELLLSQEISFIPNGDFLTLEQDELARPAAQRVDLTPVGSDLAPQPIAPGRMPAHLEQMCAAPLLTPTEERDLFFEMNFCKHRAFRLRTQLSPTSPQLDTVLRIERLLNQAMEIRNRIIHANVRLVMSIVKQFADDRNRFDDLLSEGLGCLIKAVDKFDFDRGFRFSTYATRAVRREVFRLVQRHHRDRSRFTTGTQELLGQELQPNTEPEGVALGWVQVDESVGQLLQSLDDREKFIVEARYGFEDLGEKPTFQRLGQLLGVSKERVRQIEQRALTKLRELAAQMNLEPAFD